MCSKPRSNGRLVNSSQARLNPDAIYAIKKSWVLFPHDSVPPLQLYTALRGVLLRETHETLGEGVSDDVRVLVAGGLWSQCVPE